MQTNNVWHTIRNVLVWIPILFGLILLGGHTSTTGLTFEQPADFLYYSVITPLLLFALPLFFLHLWNKDVPGKFTPKKSLIILVTIVAAAIMTYGTIKQNSNFFNLKDEQINASFAAVNTEYQRRFDEVTNIARTTASLAEHEKEIIAQISNARSSYMASNSVNDRVVAINQFEEALGRVSINVENYPNLSATAAYTELIQSIRESEERLSEAKSKYNEQARLFNSYARVIPHVWYVSSVVEETKKEYLDAQIDQNLKNADQLLNNL